MTRPFIKAKKILISDVPPTSSRGTEAGMVIAGIGIFCASVVIAAIFFVFMGT
jgi:hypothetical protein